MLVPHRSEFSHCQVTQTSQPLRTEIEIEISCVMRMNYRGTADSNSTCIRQTLNSAVTDKPCDMFV